MPTHKPMKPPFSYYGGKQRMANKIIPLLPQHTVYVEPFCGSATIMFKKPWPETVNSNHYREVINDSQGLISNFFETLQNPVSGSELCDRLALSLYSLDKYRWSVDVINREIEATDTEKALAWFVACAQSFGSSPGIGWGRSKQTNNGAYAWANKVEALPRYIQRMMSVYVDNIDALEFISRWDSPHTLFYCDPPYPNTDQHHYKGYTQDDFELLIATLDKCQGDIVLSCYPNDAVPGSWERFEFQTTMTASRKKHDINKARTECVWRRFNTAPVRPEIQKLYDSGKFDCYVPRPKDLPYGI